jgi:hypothetical protein
MSKKPRYLTKSRFKLGIECPTKLYYTGKKEYPDQKMDDSFLAALAEGGFQVGELAKFYFPGGHDITSLNYEEAEKQTLELLKQENVIIYEPAIRFQNLFIRIDVLVKKGSHFDLIEVKAKSFDSESEDPFLNKNGTIKSTWKPYLYDVAFQRYVLASSYPESTISSFLMMADKTVMCVTDGLNQKFEIVRDESNRKGVKVSNFIEEKDLEQKLLIQVPVDDEIQLIYDGKDSKNNTQGFHENIEFLAEKYEADEKIVSELGAKCASCEFRCTSEEEHNGLRNGFKECWSLALGWSDEDFNEPNVLDIWSFRKKDAFIQDGKIKISDIHETDISPTPDKKPGISASERQWLQVEKYKERDLEPFFDAWGMNEEFRNFVYPLHFIDFETTAVAIPFHKGRRPYEGVAFQFSHHIVYEDGKVEHYGQYLNTAKGKFPNYEFVRELKKQLENDNGTIFRYAPHENTYLNLIYRQLIEDQSEILDREELCLFIKNITKSVGSSTERWEGERCMVDMWELVKRYYYHPVTNGSNSIKYVLPAILNSSDYLKEKYSKPIYGSKPGIKSLNFKDWKWIEFKNGEIIDPYERLPRMFKDASDKNMRILSEDDELRNGGAALTAYGKMQFANILDYEKEELSKGLLKYCELDTLAMVMIFEAWREMLRKELNGKAAA